MLKIFTLLLLFASFLFANIGTVSLVEGKATILRNGQTLGANMGDKIENKDVISTQVNSKIKITFIDNTIVTIGKESSLNIEEYIFDTTNKSQAKTELNVLKGAFHTITGEIGKVNPDKFKLKTKSASIGIRGTEFYGDDNRIVCTQGRIVVLSNGISVDVPAGNYINIFSNQRPSEVLPLENNTLEDIEERLNTNNQGNNGNNLNSFNNNPSSPLALDGAQSNNQENIDNQNSWGNWNQNLQALQDEKNNAIINNNIQGQTNTSSTSPDILTDPNYIQDQITINQRLSYSGTFYGTDVTDSGNMNMNIFMGGSLSVSGNYEFGYKGETYNGTLSYVDIPGYDSSFVISAIGNQPSNGDIMLEGNFYGNNMDKMIGDLRNFDNNNPDALVNFSATK